MAWLLLSLLSATSESLKDAYAKLSSIHADEYSASFSLHAFNVLLIIPFVMFTGIPKITNAFWIGSFAFLFITPLWTILYMKALRLSELSKVIPLMAFNPLTTGILAFLFHESTPNVYGWVGILAICIGIYITNIQRNVLTKDILYPIKEIFKDRGSVYMLGVAILWSFGAHFSKMRVDGSSPLFSTLTGGIIGIVTTYFISLFVKKPIKIATITHMKKSMIPVGVFYFLATILSSFALHSGTATYVFAIKRSSIAISLITGKFIFKEKLSKKKVLGTISICMGIVLLALGS